MIIAGSIYNASGRIVRNVHCRPDWLSIQCRPGEWLYHGTVDGNTHYMLNHAPIARSAMPGSLNKTTILADAIDLAIINNLPQPCVVSFRGQHYEVTDGSFEFTVDLPGVYQIEVEAFPCLPATFTVEAVEP